MSKFNIHAFYKFVSLPHFEALQPELLAFCESQELKGTILLAAEGINGTVAGSGEGMANMLQWLRAHDEFTDLETKLSLADFQPFLRMKVRLKNEIVTMGVKEIDPNKKVGTYVPPEEWNALIEDPNVTLVDTRNDYEVSIGKFKGAIDPDTTTFREWPDYVKDNLDPERHKKIAMYCTGGIRCEKATAYMLEQGFAEVYHLQGGILKYLEEIPAEESLWEGECFVFDDRVAVNHDLEKGQYDMCHACRHPITEEEKHSDQYEPGVSCPKCFGKHSDQQLTRFSERQKQMDLAKERNIQHLGWTQQ